MSKAHLSHADTSGSVFIPHNKYLSLVSIAAQCAPDYFI